MRLCVLSVTAIFNLDYVGRIILIPAELDMLKSSAVEVTCSVVRPWTGQMH